MASIPSSINKWTELCDDYKIGTECFRDLNNKRIDRKEALVSGSTFSPREWCFLRSIWVDLDIEGERGLADLGVIKMADNHVGKVGRLMGTGQSPPKDVFQSPSQPRRGPSNPPSGSPRTPEGRRPHPQAGLAHRPKRARSDDEDPKATCPMSAFWTCIELMQKHARGEDYEQSHRNPPAVLQAFLLVFQEYKAIVNQPALASNSPPKFSLVKGRRHGTPDELDDDNALSEIDSPLANKGKGKASAVPAPPLQTQEGGMSGDDAGDEGDIPPKTRTEQFVASFLFMFIGCIASYAKYHEDWHMATEKSLVSHAHQVAFRVGEPRVRNNKNRSARGFTTCIDGLFAKEQDYEAKDYLAIYEVKALAREDLPKVHMQETAEFVGWISELAKDPKFKPRPLLMVCQNRDEIYINVATFGEGYLKYIRNHNERVRPSRPEESDMLTMRHSRTLYLKKVDDMTLFARIILYLALS